MYQAAGFTQKDEGLGFLTSMREMLMYKTLPPKTVHSHSNDNGGGSSGSSSSGSSNPTPDLTAGSGIGFSTAATANNQNLHSHPLTDESLPNPHRDRIYPSAAASQSGSDFSTDAIDGDTQQDRRMLGEFTSGQPEQVGGSTQSDGVFVWTAEVTNTDAAS